MLCNDCILNKVKRHHHARTNPSIGQYYMNDLITTINCYLSILPRKRKTN